METTKYYKQMKAITIATIVASLFWLYWTVGRTINTIYSVPLRESYEILQASIATGYCVFALALIAVQMIFLVKQMKNIKMACYLTNQMQNIWQHGDYYGLDTIFVRLILGK